GEREQITRRLSVAWLDDLLQLGDGFVQAAERDEHSPGIEAGEPERRTTLNRTAIFIECRVELPTSLERLAEVVMGFWIVWIDRDRAAVGVGGITPSLLQAEQHTIVIVKLGKAASESHSGMIVLFRLCPVSCRAIQL